MSLRSPMGRVRGLGAAHEGVAHWWAQRLTAAALVPLILWFVAFVCATVGQPYQAALASLHAPVNAILMTLLIVAGFHHGHLGLTVVIEDYVHTPWLKLACIVGIKFACFALGVATVFAIAKVAFAA
jgi:succinate dehydrogenase membrane anchor subunit